MTRTRNDEGRVSNWGFTQYRSGRINIMTVMQKKQFNLDNERFVKKISLGINVLVPREDYIMQGSSNRTYR